MAGKLKETLHVSVPLVATSMNNTNETGQYIPIDRCSRLLAILHGGAAVATKSWKLELLEATDNAGTGAAAITSATATGTANTKVKKATVALDSAANTDTVTVTAYVGSTVAETATYTKAASANAAENKFDNADELCTQITADFEHVSAADSTTNAIIAADDGYTITVAGANVAGEVTVATNESVTVVEVYNGELESDTTHVAPKVTVTGNGVYGVIFVQEMKDLPDAQGNLSAVYPA